MRWRKLGRVFTPQGQHGWLHSHAQIPTALVLPTQGVIRVYFATRPKPGLSLTAFLDVALDDPTRVIYLHDKPILPLGDAGSFDEHGIMPQCALKHDGRIWLYYLGWSRRVSIPYSNWVGLAVSDDDGRTFRKEFTGPVLDRTVTEIYSATGLFVLPDADGGFLGWYADGLGWTDVGGHLEERYLLKSAHSADGIEWIRSGKVVIEPKNDQEAITRPIVRTIGNRWHLWYCYRGISDFRDGANAYRIGYATSDDGRAWRRDDALAGIGVSATGWDSTMLAYPYVFDTGSRYLMFYNGNGFGASGFGVAELDPIS